MSKVLTLLALLMFGQMFTMNVAANDHLKKLVEAELAFAKKALDTNTRQAFLQYMMDDAVMFLPRLANARPFWQKREVSKAVLIWHPTWADVSPNGEVGWTSGPWESRPDGKKSKPNAFGQFVTFWIRQKDGNYKWIFDTGVSFKKSLMKEKIKYPADAGKRTESTKLRKNDDNLKSVFFGSRLAGEQFFAQDVIVLRDGVAPMRGKANAIKGLKEYVTKTFPSTDFVYGETKSRRDFDNFSFVYGTYGWLGRWVSEVKQPNVKPKMQNFFQIWKYRNDRWQIVLDFANDIPEDKAK